MCLTAAKKLRHHFSVNRIQELRTEACKSGYFSFGENGLLAWLLIACGGVATKKA
jgi:hypothetical protein